MGELRQIRPRARPPARIPDIRHFGPYRQLRTSRGGPMRAPTTLALLLVGAAAISSAVPAGAQTQRPDAIWARSTAGQHITLDGVMDEPAWQSAESRTIHYGYDNGVPGSGWKDEGGHLAKDSTNAVVKFLMDGNSLYVGF